MPPPFGLLADAVHQAAQVLHRHPQRTMFVLAAALMGTAVAAFAMAPSDARISALAIRTHVETLDAPLTTVEAQLQTLQAHPLRLSRTAVSRSTDTPESLLRRLGISDAEAAAFLRRDPTASTLIEGHADRRIRVETLDGKLMQITLWGPALDASKARTHFTRLTADRLSVGAHAALPRFETRIEQLPLQLDARVGGAIITDSLFAAADGANLPESVTGQLGEIFANDIDFRNDLRRGDRFTVVYQTYNADGEPAPWLEDTTKILAARFHNNGEMHEAVWFQRPGYRGGYHTFDGRNKQRQFLAAPLEHSRVTSGFKLRFHPVLQQWRQHLGTDYGAPKGTPVRTVGDGSVTFAGVKSGYGNVVIVQHSGDRETRYAHLSRIHVRKGQHVAQGQLIGAVGATGWATGPHLHFEFRVNDRHVDPLTVARNSEESRVDPADLPAFKTVATIAQTQLKAASTAGTAKTSMLRFE